MKNFWRDLKNKKKPFFVLAPMYDVTDAAFRQMFVKYGRPDVFFTEFVSADGLVSAAGRRKLSRELYFTEVEQPIVAQIFGKNPKTIKQATEIIRDLGLAGVDINMGCPDRTIEKQGAGAAILKDPILAQEIISAAKDGAGEMPVSVKTRIGYNQINTENWAEKILAARPAAVTFHLRTRKEMSKAKAHWAEIKIPVEMARGTGIVIIGNGDVQTPAEGAALTEKYGVDGVMIGRGAFGKPWLFANITGGHSSGDKEEWPPIATRLKIMTEHSKLFWELYGPTETNQKLFGGHTKNFAVMRKHFKAYVSGFVGATVLRAKLMQTENAEEVEKIVKDYLSD